MAALIVALVLAAFALLVVSHAPSGWCARRASAWSSGWASTSARWRRACT